MFRAVTLIGSRCSVRPVLRAFQVPSSAPLHVRAFAAGSKPKVQDGTLEGRYATALYMASPDVSKVYGDLVSLRTMMQESADLKLVIETPGINPESKINALGDICAAVGAEATVLNFLKLLVENKRSHLLGKMIDLYETFYRAEMGLVPCQVTSAEELSAPQQAEVEAAMTKRAPTGSTLLMDFKTNPALLGGLVVKLGEAVYDQSVATRLERLQNQLLAPVS